MIPAETAVGILDTCQTVRGLPVSQFGISGNYLTGNALAEILYDEGLRFRFPDNATSAQKRSTVLKACQTFQIVFDDKSKWENLDKWPY
jgi:hypothetical protein